MCVADQEEEGIVLLLIFDSSVVSLKSGELSGL